MQRSRRIRILYVIESLGRGGAEQLLVTLLPEFLRQGVDCSVLVRVGPMDLVAELEEAGIPVHCLHPRRYRWNLVGMAREIAGYVRREQIDIIHANLYFPAVGTSLLRVMGLAPVRTCVTFHNLAYAGANPTGVRLMLKRWIARRLYPRGMDHFIGVSQAVSDHYKLNFGLDDIEVIHNPVDFEGLQSVTPEAPRQFGQDAACTLVLPGRIVFEKGHLDALRALAALKEEGLAVAMTVAGDGPLREEVEAAVRSLGLAEQVTFTGALEHLALMRLVAAADIVLVPSRFEGFGLTALEAMALGKAVVATRSGGLPEVIGDAGVLVPSGDPAALADAIAALAQDPARRALLGQLARCRAKEYFSLPIIAGRYLSTYSALAGGD